MALNARPRAKLVQAITSFPSVAKNAADKEGGDPLAEAEDVSTASRFDFTLVETCV